METRDNSTGTSFCFKISQPPKILDLVRYIVWVKKEENGIMAYYGYLRILMSLRPTTVAKHIGRGEYVKRSKVFANDQEAMNYYKSNGSYEEYGINGKKDINHDINEILNVLIFEGLDKVKEKYPYFYHKNRTTVRTLQHMAIVYNSAGYRIGHFCQEGKMSVSELGSDSEGELDE